MWWVCDGTDPLEGTCNRSGLDVSTRHSPGAGALGMSELCFAACVWFCTLCLALRNAAEKCEEAFLLGVPGGAPALSLLSDIRTQHSTLVGSVERLRAFESKRTNVITLLSEALRKQVSWHLFFAPGAARSGSLRSAHLKVLMHLRLGNHKR